MNLFILRCRMYFRGRVDGDLAVSRGFGDFAYKGVAALPAREQRVSCIPDIKIVERTDNDEVLLLACDGLWDVMSNEQSMLAMREMFKEGESEPALMVEEMLDLSLQLGSKDNISAVALLLPGSKALIASDGEGVIGRRELRDMEAHKAQQERASAAEDEDDDDGPSCPAGFSKQKGTCPFGAGKM